MPRPKTAAERGIATDDGTIKVGMTVRFKGGEFTYRVTEIKKNWVRGVGANGSVLITEPECLEVVP